MISDHTLGSVVSTPPGLQLSELLKIEDYEGIAALLGAKETVQTDFIESTLLVSISKHVQSGALEKLESFKKSLPVIFKKLIQIHSGDFLKSATKYKHVSIVLWLIESGASVTCEEQDCLDLLSLSAISLAIEKKYEKIAGILEIKGTSIRIQNDKGQSAESILFASMVESIKNDHLDELKACQRSLPHVFEDWLLTNGFGNQLLSVAMIWGRTSIIKWLIECAKDPDISQEKNHFMKNVNLTFKSLAQQGQYKEIMKLSSIEGLISSTQLEAIVLDSTMQHAKLGELEKIQMAIVNYHSILIEQLKKEDETNLILCAAQHGKLDVVDWLKMLIPSENWEKLKLIIMKNQPPIRQEERGEWEELLPATSQGTDNVLYKSKTIIQAARPFLESLEAEISLMPRDEKKHGSIALPSTVISVTSSTENFRKAVADLFYQLGKCPQTSKKACFITNETAIMLKNLREVKENDETQNNKLMIIQDYARKCEEQVSGWRKVSRYVGCVVSAAVGFVFGALIAGTVGAALGCLSGPGAVFTGAVGFFAGGCKGAAMGVSLFSAFTLGTSTGLLSCKYIFFKPSNDVLDQSTKKIIMTANAMLKLGQT